MLTLVFLAVVVILWAVMNSSRLFHLAAYSASLGNVTNQDTTFATDGILAVSNNHLLLVDDFNPIALYGNGANLARIRFNNAQLLQYSIPHVWPLDTSATPPTIPAVMDLAGKQLNFPINEEIIVESTTTAVGPQQINLLMWLADPGWNNQRSPSLWNGVIRATATTPAGAAGTWSAEAALTFERGLRNGVYEIWGAEVFQATGVAFRFRLPDQVGVHGKQLRPGGLNQTAVGLQPWRKQRGEDGGLGIWGRFFSLAPPVIQMFGDAAGGTAEIRLYVSYVGEDRNLTFRVPGQVQ
jgi:hypothetical protein